MIRSWVFCFLTTAAQAAEPVPFYHTSYPEASAVAVAGTPPRWLVVADNELPSLALYPLELQSDKLHRPALIAGTSPAYAVDDLEAMTVLPWDPNGDGKPEAVYHVLAASCARTKKGKVVAEREALLAVRIDADGKWTPAAEVKINRTLRAQLRALGGEHAGEPWGAVLRESVWKQGGGSDSQDAALAGEAGLNIEGLTVRKDGRALLLGLRSPLVQGRALVIPITNPVAALGLGGSDPQPVAAGEPVLLNLGGLGIRSMEWDAERKAYLIAAGDAGDARVFQFYTWTGEAGAAPVSVKAAGALTRLQPEGIAPVPGRKQAAVVMDGEAGGPHHQGYWVDFGPAR